MHEIHCWDPSKVAIKAVHITSDLDLYFEQTMY